MIFDGRLCCYELSHSEYMEISKIIYDYGDTVNSLIKIKEYIGNKIKNSNGNDLIIIANNLFKDYINGNLKKKVYKN